MPARYSTQREKCQKYPLPDACQYSIQKINNNRAAKCFSNLFPAYSKREKTVQTLQDRINNCFMRSMNGKRPIIDTKASVAMAAYITWLSEGLPIRMNPKKPVNPYYTNLWPNKKLDPVIRSATHKNYVRGKGIYESRCSSCHGSNGQGIGSFPPLWDSNSYNT